MPSVTARDFQRNFGEVQDRVLRGEHVCVTHHGRPRMMVMSAVEYELLKNGVAHAKAGEVPEEWAQKLRRASYDESGTGAEALLIQEPAPK